MSLSWRWPVASRFGCADFWRQPARLVLILSGDLPRISLLARGQAPAWRRCFSSPRRSFRCLRIIRVGSLRVHLFADCRKCARGPFDVCGSRFFPHAGASPARSRPGTRRTRRRRPRARQYGGADEPRDLLYADASPVSIVLVLTVISILRQPADLGGGTAPGLILGNLVGGLAATVAYLLVTLLPYPAFLLACRLAGRAYLGRTYRARRKVGADLHGWTYDVPHLARAWALALTAGQRHPLRCPRLRRHGGGCLCHRHGQPVAFGVSRSLIFWTRRYRFAAWEARRRTSPRRGGMEREAIPLICRIAGSGSRVPAPSLRRKVSMCRLPHRFVPTSVMIATIIGEADWTARVVLQPEFMFFFYALRCGSFQSFCELCNWPSPFQLCGRASPRGCTRIAEAKVQAFLTESMEQSLKSH